MTWKWQMLIWKIKNKQETTPEETPTTSDLMKCLTRQNSSLKQAGFELLHSFSEFSTKTIWIAWASVLKGAEEKVMNPGKIKRLQETPSKLDHFYCSNTVFYSNAWLLNKSLLQLIYTSHTVILPIGQDSEFLKNFYYFEGISSEELLKSWINTR